MKQPRKVSNLLIQFTWLFTTISIFTIIIYNTDKSFATNLVDGFLRILNISIFIVYYQYLREIRNAASIETYREKRRKIAFFIFFFTWILTTGLLISESLLKHLDVRWLRFTLGGLCMSAFTILLVHISVKYALFSKSIEKL